jgi:hypothetical protein
VAGRKPLPIAWAKTSSDQWPDTSMRGRRSRRCDGQAEREAALACDADEAVVGFALEVGAIAGHGAELFHGREL